MRCDEIVGKLEELSPLSYAAQWDNVGLLIGRNEKEINRIYIALDATDAVIEEAVRLKADLLLTHHPLIFSSLKQIRSDDFLGRRILKLIQHDMNYYAMHTNFDVMGMADAASDEMSLSKSQVLDITYEDDIAKEGFGRFGLLPKTMTLLECAEFVKKCFNIEKVKVFGDLDGTVESAAVAPGSGKSMIKPALRAGVDVLITGDIDHHEGIDSVAQGLAIIDAGHYGIEQLFVPYMKEFLDRELQGLTIFTKNAESPFNIL